MLLIWNLLEKLRTFKKVLFGKENARSALAYNPKGMMGNGQENNGGRCSGLYFGQYVCVKLKNTRLERTEPHRVY